MGVGRNGWRADLCRVAGALVLEVGAGFIFYGMDLFRSHTPAFQLPTIGLAGGTAYVALRRGGWRPAILLAFLVLFLELLLLGSLGHRTGWPALLWSAIIGPTVVAGCAIFLALGPLIRFGRFVFSSLAVGVGFTLSSVVLGWALDLPPMIQSVRVNFAVGSLAGAALGLGLELVEIALQRNRHRS